MQRSTPTAVNDGNISTPSRRARRDTLVRPSREMKDSSEYSIQIMMNNISLITIQNNLNIVLLFHYSYQSRNL